LTILGFGLITPESGGNRSFGTGVESGMHTDEYEISIAREINHCQRVVTKTKKKLEERRRRFGMDFAEVARIAAEGGTTIDARELAAWREDVEALPVWEQRLEEYRQALSVMRISASRF
jgi:hypothetical protein